MQFMPTCPSGHMLSIGGFHEKWTCQRAHTKKCLSGCHPMPRTQKVPRWRCNECDFDLCLKCYNDEQQKDARYPDSLKRPRGGMFDTAQVVPLQLAGTEFEDPTLSQKLKFKCKIFCKRNCLKLSLLFLGFVILGIVMLVQATSPDCPEKKKAVKNAGEDNKKICCYHNMFGRYVKQDCPSSGSGRGGASNSGRNNGSGRSSSGSSCFVTGTSVILENNHITNIEDLQLGDVLLNGGVVEAMMKVWGENEPLYDIDGIVVSGTHAIRDSYDLVWKRVLDVEERTRLLRTEAVLWNVVTSDHRLELKKPNSVGTIMAADYMEAEESSAMRQASLAYLNNDIYNVEDALQVETTNHELDKEEAPRHLASCFPPETLVLLEDGVSTIRIEEVEVGSRVAGGGLVQSVMKLIGEHEPLYDVEGVAISQFHSVLDPTDKVWRHAKDVLQAKKLDSVSPVLFNLITKNHRMFVTSSTARIPVEVADFLELDEDDELLDWNLLQLNIQNDRISKSD